MMFFRHSRAFLRGALLLAMLAAAPQGCQAQETRPAPVTATFNRNCEPMVLAEIGKARREILLAAFLITRPSVVTALTQAARQGVRVRVKYDARQADYEGMRESLATLRKQHIRCSPISMDDEHASMHDKFIVIDRQRVLTGSYNFTTPASEKNYENLVLIEMPSVASQYAAEFEAIRSR